MTINLSISSVSTIVALQWLVSSVKQSDYQRVDKIGLMCTQEASAKIKNQYTDFVGQIGNH